MVIRSMNDIQGRGDHVENFGVIPQLLRYLLGEGYGQLTIAAI